MTNEKMTYIHEYFEQFRHLNLQMNKIPPLSVTLTGGVWYAAVIVKGYGDGLSAETEALARYALMVFSGIVNVALILIALRIRGVMKTYQIKLKEIAGTQWPSFSDQKLFGFIDYSMISIYIVLMLAGALLSFFGGYVLHWEATGLANCIGLLGPFLVIFLLFLLAWILPRCFKK